MEKFFSSENKIFIFLSKVFDLMVLGIIWIVFVLGIPSAVFFLLNKVLPPLVLGILGLLFFVTFVPTCTAMYYATVKVIRRERSYLLKEFWHSFKLNFRQGVVISIIYELIGTIMYVDFLWVSQMEEGTKYTSMLTGVFIAICIFVVLTALYIFPLLSRFTVKTGQLFRWAFLLSVRHFLTTLIMLACLLATVVLGYYCVVTTVAVPLLLILPALYMLLISFPMEKVMKKYMPKVEETEEESGVDHWYNE